MNGTSESSRLTLRDLPVAARLTLAAFLISVGIGYFSALVQLHFQHARPGELMPTPEDAEKTFSDPPADQKPISRLERLLMADAGLPFNGNGQMAAAFTTRSDGWKSALKKRAKALAKKRGAAEPDDGDKTKAETDLRTEREGEREAVLAWLRNGADKKAFDKDRFALSTEMASRPLTPTYVEKDGEEKILKIKTLFSDRCVTCHVKEGGRDAKAGDYPLEKYEQISTYTKVDSGGAMPLTKLAQTTHVHLLGFAMLYGLTGLILAFTGYPTWLRVPLAPLPLLAQVVDISLWWLARLDEPYGRSCARLIPLTGAIVGASLGLQLLLGLFDLFGRVWKIGLFVVIALALGGGWGLKQKVIDPHLLKEKTPTTASREGND